MSRPRDHNESRRLNSQPAFNVDLRVLNNPSYDPMSTWGRQHAYSAPPYSAPLYSAPPYSAPPYSAPQYSAPYSSSYSVQNAVDRHNFSDPGTFIGMDMGVQDPPEYPQLENDETNLKKKIVRLEIFSGFLSIVCLITSFVFAMNEGFDKYVHLTRNVIIYSRKPENKFALKTWVTQYNDYCPSHPQTLLVPAWETLNKEKYDGVGMLQSVFASKLYIWPLAFTVFLCSAFFQLSRGLWYKQYFNPLDGPDYSRWLEYLVTSPLQVVLVAIAFGFSDRDQLLSWAGVQAALVILGYSIEKQIKKVYIRNMVNHDSTQHETKNFSKFYNILHSFEIRDIRLFVYLALSWFLHFCIWGIPIINSVGIGSRYALQEDHNESCEKDPKFKIPDFVLGLYWSQFVCFTLFGVVATIQAFQAFNGKLITKESSKNDVKKSSAYRKRWGWYSLAYAILSVTCKTLLEVFFIGFIRMYTIWPIVETPAFSVNSNNLQTSQPYRISNVVSLNTSTTQLNVKDFDSMCYLYPLQK